MIRRIPKGLLGLIAFETLLIVGAVAAATYIRLGADALPIFLSDRGILKTLLLAAITQICLYYNDLYDLRRASDPFELFVGLLQAIGTASIVWAVLFFVFPETIIGKGRFVFMLAAVFLPVLLGGWRLLYGWAGRQIAPRERLLLVGTNPAAIALAKELFDRRHELRVAIVGFVDPDPARVGQPVINPGIIGTVDDIPAIVKAHAVDRVVVSLTDARGKLPMDQLLEMKLDQGVAFDHLTSVYEEYTGKIAVSNLRPSWLIFSEGFRKTRAMLASKRAVDLLCATIGLVLAAPLMLLTALLIKLTSKGPVFYHQTRVGHNGRTFTAHKFRSMRADAEAATGAVWARSNDDRVTPVGRFIRRTRLDETPQLWNVLTGEMSLVGPRPERPEFVAKLTDQIPFYGLRHSVRPGLTGWAQVRYTYGASVEDALEKLQYDLFYIKHMAVMFDLFILFSTIKTVVLRRGAQ
jgi:sugar transferase (PEP-CTERM system associated)